MQIPLIYVLIGAELLLIFFGLSITFGILLLRRPATTSAKESSPEESEVIHSGLGYIEHLNMAMERNTAKQQQHSVVTESNEEDGEADVIELDADEDTETTSENTPDESAQAPDELQSTLLQIREQFLTAEKAAAEQTEHEINFWDSIYSSMQDIIESLRSFETITNEKSSVETVSIKGESKEKVFYIETQGKKIDTEVNRLKDIIYEQENALNSMKSAIDNNQEGSDVDPEVFKFLKEQLDNVERQLSDSKMCMEVLEMENNRLQEEIDQLEAQAFATPTGDEPEATSNIDLDELKKSISDQEEKINELLRKIDELELSAEEAEQLKETVRNFTLTSKEMMQSIAQLEEENEALKSAMESDGSIDANTGTSSSDSGDLSTTISELQEEIIKKDLAYAQLQDEFSSMESEYLAMYEAMHGDGS